MHTTDTTNHKTLSTSAAADLLAWVLAGAASGGAYVAADALVRFQYVGANPHGWFWSVHAAGAFSLFASLGIIAGFSLWLLYLLQPDAKLLTSLHQATRRAAILRRVLLQCFAGVVAAYWVAVASCEDWKTFVSGVCLLGAFVFFACLVAFGPIVADVVNTFEHRTPHLMHFPGVLLSVSCGLLGSGFAWADWSVLNSLYPRFHALLELMAVVCWLLSMRVLLRIALRRIHQYTLLAFLASVLGCLAVLYVVAGGPAWSSTKLEHTAIHRVFVGRFLVAVRCSDLLSPVIGITRGDPGQSRCTFSTLGAPSDEKCPVDWEPCAGAFADEAVRSALPAKPNIVVFYVDTLRADTASDPGIMPNMAEFAQTSVDFSRTYSTGSNTFYAVPQMIFGTYDASDVGKRDAVSVARSLGLRTALVVSSKHSAVSRVLPYLRFEETIEIVESGPETVDFFKADSAVISSGLIADASLDWINNTKDSQFFLWQHHGNLHEWLHIDESLILGHSTGAVQLRSDRDRYNAVAAIVDAAFGRFIRGIDAMGMVDNTIVMVVSDHGEALGERGYRIHTQFLWESLVRVPLFIRIPGVSPQVVDSATSVIDIAPTIARVLSHNASLAPYHGEDLLAQLGPAPPKRRFPILMRSQRHFKRAAAMVGVVDDAARRKLVLPLSTNLPELYDLSDPEPDEVNLAQTEPSVVKRLLAVVREGPLNPAASTAHEHCARMRPGTE